MRGEGVLPKGVVKMSGGRRGTEAHDPPKEDNKRTDTNEGMQESKILARGLWVRKEEG